MREAIWAEFKAFYDPVGKYALHANFEVYAIIAENTPAQFREMTAQYGIIAKPIVPAAPHKMRRRCNPDHTLYLQ